MKNKEALQNRHLFFKDKTLLFFVAFPFLLVLSLLYQFFVLIVQALYLFGPLRTYRAQCRVISIGNITVGGTGKTPATEWVARYVSERQKKIGIIIRGYKRPGSCEHESCTSDYCAYGDEAALLKHNFPTIPVLVGRDKVRSARQLEQNNYDVAVLDDGFQHWRLHRDLNIVTIDSSFSLEGNFVLPLGKLREPLNGLRRADIFVVTKADLYPDNYQRLRKQLSEYHSGAIVVGSKYQAISLVDVQSRKTISLNGALLRQAPVCVMAGIVQPEYFLKMLGDCGIKVTKAFFYPDHHAYSKQDIEIVRRFAENKDIAMIITTQKDAVRMEHLPFEFGALKVYYLKIELDIIDNKQAFCEKIDSLFSPKRV